MTDLELYTLHYLRAEACEMRYEELYDMYKENLVDRGLLRAHVWKLDSAIAKYSTEEKTTWNVRTFSYYYVKKQLIKLDQLVLYQLL